MNPNQAENMIDTDPPGTVLRDIHVLLDMLRTEGIDAGSGDVPAMGVLAEINARLAEPLQVDLKRAQFRSYPNIQALYLLLRTTGLLRVQRAGAKGNLVADAPLADAFCSLNPTEQFGSLLDAWLVKAQFAAIGINRGWPHDFISAALRCWKAIRAAGRRFTVEDRGRAAAAFASEVDRVTLWLLRAFGLIELGQGKAIAGKPWHPASVRRTVFGEATLATLPREITPDDDDAEPAGLRDAISFDALKPLFQPQWPAWRQSLTLPGLPFREGAFIFKVSVANAWRRIAIPARSTLVDLSDAILDSVRFDFDHFWEFKFQDRFGRSVAITHPEMDSVEESHFADDVLIGDLPLAEGETMSYLYDYGDNWQFDVTLEYVDAERRKLKTPKVVESHGRAPVQYGDWDDE